MKDQEKGWGFQGQAGPPSDEEKTVEHIVIPTDPSLQFDMFEDVRRNLTEVFVRSGHELLEAERIALYVVEGIRHVPKLMQVAARTDPSAQDKTLNALGAVLDDAARLEKAKRLLLHLDEDAGAAE